MKPDNQQESPASVISWPERPRLLTVREVAEWLQVSPAWVRAHASGNRRPCLPCVRLGGHIRFERKGVAEWLAEQRRNYEARKAVA